MYATAGFFADFWHSAGLMLRLAGRDFKNRYAGTAFGAAWALVQPAVTVAVYAFVFSIGFRSAPVTGVPYVLWLIAALLPWLFFQELVTGAAGALYEYAYLVKKTVFPCQLLPAVKAGGAALAHAAFMLLALLSFLISGRGVGVYMAQLPYYFFCALAFGLGLGYLFAALAPFFKDVLQFVGVLMQILFWLTPIAWDVNIMSGPLQELIRLNPLFYAVQGYRDSFIGGVWFFERPVYTFYFWAVTLALWTFSTYFFMKLRPQYADVL